MSRPTHLSRAERVGIALLVGLALAAAPTAAQAATIDLATARPFAVLGGSSVTNAGPSVLNGDLGVSPGTSLVGFGPPAVVNGATHQTDGVANGAQADLTTAYNTAAGEPSDTDLTGQDLGGLTLTPGTYTFASSAQLTGALTLDGLGNPAARFVFQIGSALTTASASAVTLVNSASPCNVFWQIGSSATLGSTTAFQGNLMALQDVSLNSGASVVGRVLAKRDITLIDNRIDQDPCDAVTTTPTGGGTTTGGGGGDGGTATTGGGSGGGGAGVTPAPDGGAQPLSVAGPPLTAVPSGSATLRRTPGAVCTDGFRATVRGSQISRVVFSIDGRRIGSRTGSPFSVSTRARPGRHVVTARVTFRDGTQARTLRLPYRACAAAVRRPRRGPSQFTG